MESAFNFGPKDAMMVKICQEILISVTKSVIWGKDLQHGKFFKIKISLSMLSQK